MRKTRHPRIQIERPQRRGVVAPPLLVPRRLRKERPLTSRLLSVAALVLSVAIGVAAHPLPDGGGLATAMSDSGGSSSAVQGRSPPGRGTRSLPSTDSLPVQRNTVGRVEHLRTLPGHREQVYSLEFSGDGAYLASSGADREIKVWDVRTGRLAHTLQVPFAGRHDVAFSPAGHLLATANRIWEVKSWQVVQTPRQGEGPVAFSPDGSLLAIAAALHPIVLWDVASGRVVRTLDHPAGDVFRCLAFSPDGTLLAAGASDYIVRIWDVASGRLARTIHHAAEGQPREHMLDLAFSPNGRVLASSGTDLIGRLWNVESWQVTHELGIGGAPTGLAFSPDGTILASSGPTLQLWDAENGRLLRALAHRDPIDVAFSPDGLLLASAGHDHVIHLWGVPR